MQKTTETKQERIQRVLRRVKMQKAVTTSRALQSKPKPKVETVPLSNQKVIRRAGNIVYVRFP